MDFETSDILYTGSAILTVAGILTFVGGESMLSPVTKMSVMACLFTLFLGVGVFVDRKMHKGLVFGLAAVTYLVGTFYALSKFGFSSDTGFLSLIISAALFTGLGQLITNDRIGIDRDQLKLGFVVLVLLSASVTLFDVTGDQPSYILNLQDEVSLNNTSEADVGNLIIQNNFILPREVDQPNYRACIYPDTDARARVNIDTTYGTELIAGNGAREKSVTLSVRPDYYEEQENPEPLGTFKLETADQCQDSSSERKIVITETEDSIY